VIGEIFYKVYNLGALGTSPLGGIQTVTVPAGGAVTTEFKSPVPGNYLLLIARMERDLVGCLPRRASLTRYL
jgi:nitrite reductase (NO-forming)